MPLSQWNAGHLTWFNVSISALSEFWNCAVTVSGCLRVLIVVEFTRFWPADRVLTVCKFFNPFFGRSRGRNDLFFLQIWPNDGNKKKQKIRKKKISFGWIAGVDTGQWNKICICTRTSTLEILLGSGERHIELAQIIHFFTFSHATLGILSFKLSKRLAADSSIVWSLRHPNVGHYLFRFFFFFNFQFRRLQSIC